MRESDCYAVIFLQVSSQLLSGTGISNLTTSSGTVDPRKQRVPDTPASSKTFASLVDLSGDILQMSGWDGAGRDGNDG